jgi:hypothetical protein
MPATSVVPQTPLTQTFPQAPQFSGSLASTHVTPQRSWFSRHGPPDEEPAELVATVPAVPDDEALTEVPDAEALAELMNVMAPPPPVGCPPPVAPVPLEP